MAEQSDPEAIQRYVAEEGGEVSPLVLLDWLREGGRTMSEALEECQLALERGRMWLNLGGYVVVAPLPEPKDDHHG